MISIEFCVHYNVSGKNTDKYLLASDRSVLSWCQMTHHLRSAGYIVFLHLEVLFIMLCRFYTNVQWTPASATYLQLQCWVYSLRLMSSMASLRSNTMQLIKSTNVIVSIKAKHESVGYSGIPVNVMGNYLP